MALRFKFFIFSLSLVACTYLSLAQEYYAPLHQNFSTEKFNLSTSNFEIIQQNKASLLFGNLEGILVKQGKSWSSLKVNKGDIIFKLYEGPNHEIFFGSNKSFGYLTSDLNGNLKYEYLVTDASSRIKKIVGNDHDVLFQSKEKLYVYNQDSLYSIANEASGFQTAFSSGNKLYIKEYNDGLKNFNQLNSISLYKEKIGDLILSTPITYQNKLLFSSYPDFNFYSVLNNHIDEYPLLNKEDHHLLEQAIPYQAVELDSVILFSTRRMGLLTVNPKQKAFQFFDQNKGLPSNTTAHVINDTQFNHWISTQSGLTQIELSPKWNQWNEKNGLANYIFQVTSFKGNISVGTTNGLYTYNNGTWNKNSAIKSRILGLYNNREKLFINAPEIGLFQIDSLGTNRINEVPTKWSVVELYNNDVAYIAVEETGIYQLEEKNNERTLKLILSKPIGIPRQIKAIDNEEIWLSIKWEGLMHLKITERDTSIYFYDEKYGLPNTSEIDIISIDDHLLFTTSEGFYEINKEISSDSSNFFIPAKSISTKEPIIAAAVDKNKNIWYATVDKFNDKILKKLKRFEDGRYVDDSKGLRRFPNQIVNQIYPDPNKLGVIWIAGNKGLYRYDDNIQINYNKSFTTFINKVTSNDSLIFNGFYIKANKGLAPSFVNNQPEEYIPFLPYESNNIKIDYSSSAYTLSEKNTYSIKLDGLEDKWSNWTRNTQKEYSNLSPGSYTFHVRSKNLYGTEGEPTSYTFEILAPWYLTNWAKAIFGIITAFIIWMIALLYSYRLRKHRKHLKLLVADRTFEVLKQKKEIEKQLQQLADKNEELLLQSEQIEIKNTELKESQEEIIQINNQLEEVNKQLEKKVEKRTAKIKSTLEKLKQTNKELDTFIYKASHDLKGPLSRILGLASLAKLETPSAKNSQYLEMIERTSHDMDLLLSKLTQVHEIFNQQPKSVPLLVEETLEEIKTDLNYLYTPEESVISLKNEVDQPIKADPQLFKIILFNLVENSLIFQNKEINKLHKIDVLISKTDNQITLTITDNGIGIEEDQIDSIFDMFYRASAQSKGSGLGLYLVKIAVEKMKGSIQVESIYEEYTAFTVNLPI